MKNNLADISRERQIDKQYNKSTTKFPESKYDPIFKKLFDLNNSEDIINYLIENKARTEYLGHMSILRYIRRFHDSDTSEVKTIIVNTLKAKIQVYQEYLKNQKMIVREEQKQAILAPAQQTVQSFIDNGYDVDTFCLSNDLEKDAFNDYITIIKKDDAVLYDTYQKKLMFQKNMHNSELIGKIRYIAKMISAGVTHDGNSRPFNILDYYLITNVSLETVLENLSDTLTTKELTVLRRFYEKNIDIPLGEYGMKNILDEIIEINCQKDERGFPIPGTGRIISIEEKQLVIDYLNSKYIPITSKTYSLALRRYLAGLLPVLGESEERSPHQF